MAQDMAMLNTFFRKDYNQLATYKSGGRSSQIDFLMCRRRDLRDVKDCRVLDGDDVAAQHRLLAAITRSRKERKGRENRQRKIKWWKLKEQGLKRQFKEKVLHNWTDTENIQVWWTTNSRLMRESAEIILGRTSGICAPADKETWWWNEEMQAAVKTKKTL